MNYRITSDIPTLKVFEYVADDYEIVCWDIVSDPSTPNAWITPEDKIPQQYVENKENDETKSKLFENLDEFTEWLND